MLCGDGACLRLCAPSVSGQQPLEIGRLSPHATQGLQVCRSAERADMAIWCGNGVSKVMASSGSEREFVESVIYLVPASGDGVETSADVRSRAPDAIDSAGNWAVGIHFPFPGPQNWNRAVENGREIEGYCGH